MLSSRVCREPRKFKAAQFTPTLPSSKDSIAPNIDSLVLGGEFERSRLNIKLVDNRCHLTIDGLHYFLYPFSEMYVKGVTEKTFKSLE